MAERVKIIIDRAKHRTGRYGRGYSSCGLARLLNPEGFRCCLGFQGKALGVEDDQTLRKLMPADCGDWNAEVSCVAVTDVMSFDQLMAAINDALGVDDVMREEWIIEGFQSIGQDCEFIGEYPPL